MNVTSRLLGLRFESVTLAKGSISFELDGMKNDQHHRYHLTTQFDVCFDANDVFKHDIVDDASTANVWSYLESDLIKILLSEDGRICELCFSNGKSIFVASLEFEHDNLFVVNRHGSDEWFTIG